MMVLDIDVSKRWLCQIVYMTPRAPNDVRCRRVLLSAIIS